jgi:predicted DNA binding CopG/RHH family protein
MGIAEDNMSQTKDKRIFVRLGADLHRQAHEQAAKQGLKLSEVIRDLLRWWIKTGANVEDLDK